jgi:uncharacterized membrane protein YphA (DoxX/SURF4 family)
MRIFELTVRDKGCDRCGSSIAIRQTVTKFPRPPMRRLSPTVNWSISIILALLFAAVGFSKLWGPSAMRWGSRFVNWGYPVGSQYFVGAVEIISGLALVLPRSRKYAAGSLTLVMAGALCTHLVHGELLRVIAPLILGVLAFLLFFFTPVTGHQRSIS